jgi:hypothetical protein
MLRSLVDGVLDLFKRNREPQIRPRSTNESWEDFYDCSETHPASFGLGPAVRLPLKSMNDALTARGLG